MVGRWLVSLSHPYGADIGLSWGEDEQRLCKQLQMLMLNL